MGDSAYLLKRPKFRNSLDPSPEAMSTLSWVRPTPRRTDTVRESEYQNFMPFKVTASIDDMSRFL